MAIIKESLKRIWNAEEIRTLVLVSLCLQFGLVILSPSRKFMAQTKAQKLFKLLLWFFYLIAYSVAILALGNLLRRQNEGASGCHDGVGLMAFWAPFLLLHLGGPDTITSYSIEDNELWWRHFLVLVVQVVVAFMVWLELVVIPKLRVAAAFVFIAGLVKYSERTWALRSSSMDQLRNSRFVPGSNSEELEETKNIERQNEPLLPVQFPSNINAPGNIYHTQITEAYEVFKIFKPFVVDHRLLLQQYEESKTYFRNCDVLKAFKVVEIELSFLYDVLHTKAVLINGLHGCLWRFISLGMISSAFVLFLKSEKRGYAKADIIISYILFGSALFMELISLLIIIPSDWMILALIKEKKHSLPKNLGVIIAKLMSCFFPKGKPRWSNSMGQYSFLSFSLRDKKTIFRWILGAIKVKELWDNFIFVRSVPVPSELKELLFEKLKTKTTGVKDISNIIKLRDLKLDKVLEHEAFDRDVSFESMGFDEIMLMWHIATDLCFHIHGAMNENPETSNGRNDNNSHSSNREISLKMSNYMMYLLIMQPSMMPDGIEAIRKFQDTYTEAKNIFRAVGKVLTKEEAREALLFQNADSNDEFEDSRKGVVLRAACILANKLNQLADEQRWRIMSRVWVEMLCYVAINCKTYYHSKQLSQGGELLTHVMLLMVHMGIPQKIPSTIDIYAYKSMPLYN